MSQLVWYAAYGSNLSRQRFLHYLEGGCPPGASRTHDTCVDPTPPRDDRAYEMYGDMYFGGPSRNWGGGIAFFEPTEGAVRSRLYLITEEQFEHVCFEENGQSSTGWYEVRTDVGSLDGYPIVTLTTPEKRDFTPPTPAYLRCLVQGLRESHRMADENITGYLLSKRGIVGELSREEVFATVQA